MSSRVPLSPGRRPCHTPSGDVCRLSRPGCPNCCGPWRRWNTALPHSKPSRRAPRKSPSMDDATAPPASTSSPLVIDSLAIQSYLPHRYPFLFVDRIIELERYKRAVGLKNVTANEPFFMGHFPERPVMPGVLILEAMAQVAGVLAFYSLGGRRDYIPLFTGIDKARFRTPVVPGDQLRMELEVLR